MCWKGALLLFAMHLFTQESSALIRHLVLIEGQLFLNQAFQMTEAQEGQETCLRSYSKSVALLGLEPRTVQGYYSLTLKRHSFIPP